jgi:hypothetical protein
MRFRRWAAAIFITTYLSWLAFGIVGQALKLNAVGNTLGYFNVWDMFCGWHAYDNRTHLIGEDAAGRYYAIREPWGAFQPFGHVDRINYDVSNNLAPRHIRHVLSRTAHPPIDRVYVVQEIWPKHFNAPDRHWAHYFHEPREPVSYYNLRAICRADGTPIEAYPDWFSLQINKSIADNPRLKEQSQQATPYFNTFFNPQKMNAAAEFTGNGSLGLSTN